jgi:hypothetical protein
MKSAGNILLISGEGRKTGMLVKQFQNKCRKKLKTDLRLRLLSNPKLVILLTGHIRGTPKPGVPENVPVRAYQCLDWGVSRSRLFRFAYGTQTQNQN